MYASCYCEKYDESLDDDVCQKVEYHVKVIYDNRVNVKDPARWKVFDVDIPSKLTQTLTLTVSNLNRHTFSIQLEQSNRLWLITEN